MANDSDYEYSYHGNSYGDTDLDQKQDNFTLAFNITPHVTDCIRHYTFYVITVFGCVSNVIILVVLLNSRRMRRAVSGVFLIAVAIADIFVLITEQVNSVMLDRTYHGNGLTALASCPSQQEIVPAGPVLCTVITYFKYTLRCLSTLIILAISAHRFIVMKFPLTSKKVSNLRSALIQIALMVAMSFLANIYAAQFTSTSFGCVPVDQDIYTRGVTVVIVVICDILGSSAIIVFSILTVRLYVGAGKPFLQRQDSCTNQNRKDGERHMTILLLTVALTFVFMRLPYTFTWLPVHFHLVPEDSPLNYVINITKCIHLAKHAIKLYLYCICSHGFREELRLVFLRVRRPSALTSGYRTRTFTGSSTTMNRVIQSTPI